MFTNICRHILIFVKNEKKPTLSQRPAFISAMSWVVFWIETGCIHGEFRAGAGGKVGCQNITFGHDRFVSVYEMSVIIDSKSIVKTRTQLTVCVCKPCEDTFEIESNVVFCV
jgi:hypothetical protein